MTKGTSAAEQFQSDGLSWDAAPGVHHDAALAGVPVALLELAEERQTGGSKQDSAHRAQEVDTSVNQIELLTCVDGSCTMSVLRVVLGLAIWLCWLYPRSSK